MVPVGCLPQQCTTALATLMLSGPQKGAFIALDPNIRPLMMATRICTSINLAALILAQYKYWICHHLCIFDVELLKKGWWQLKWNYEKRPCSGAAEVKATTALWLIWGKDMKGHRLFDGQYTLFHFFCFKQSMSEYYLSRISLKRSLLLEMTQE